MDKVQEIPIILTNLLTSVTQKGLETMWLVFCLSHGDDQSYVEAEKVQMTCDLDLITSERKSFKLSSWSTILNLFSWGLHH
jgi:hypothetical protein